MDKYFIRAEKVCLKIRRIMRLTLIMTLTGILYASASPYAQEHRVSVNVEDGTFYDVVTQIEKQSEFMFFYKSEEINNDWRVTLVARNRPVFEVLDELLRDQGLGYRIIDRHIIIITTLSECSTACSESFTTFSECSTACSESFTTFSEPSTTCSESFTTFSKCSTTCSESFTERSECSTTCSESFTTCSECSTERSECSTERSGYFTARSECFAACSGCF
jgi:hypothetical protein